MSIRRQLLGLFGVLLMASVGLLLLQDWESRNNARDVQQIKEQSLGNLRLIKAVSDAYGLDYVSTTFRVRNYLIPWEEGVRVVDNARARIHVDWPALSENPQDEQQRSLIAQIDQARVRADLAALQLREILQKQDIGALGRFADTELFPAIDPVTTRLKLLGVLQLLEADRMIQAMTTRSREVALFRMAFIIAVLALVAVLASSMIRNIYKGVESLRELSQQMRQHDYQAAPRFRAEGELGEVLDGFLIMRDDVRRFESELNDQLLRNEQVRASLERSEVFQRSLFAAARVAVLAFDLQGRFTSFNPFAERLTGYAAEEMLGRHTEGRLLLGEEKSRMAARLSAELGRPVPTGAGLFPVMIERAMPPQEWTFVHKDGTHIPVLLATSAMTDDSGELVGFLGVATDLTLIKQMEAQLRASEAAAQEANLAKSSFLAAMSHEIRTPLIGVTSMLEVLSHSQLDADQRRTIHVIQQSAASLLQIIGDILDFSKVEAGRLELSPTTISLPKLLQSSAANFAGSASSKGLVLHVSIDERIGPAHVADGLRLRQVISNFISNAIKFTEAGSVEAALDWLGSEAGRDRIAIRVTDTGIGVTDEQKAKLFQPFSQAEGSTTRRFGGTGLGLVISQRLAELMGGEVTMDSVAGKGTTLRLQLDLPRGRIEDLESESSGFNSPMNFSPRPLPTVAQAEAENSLILIVDDHPTNRLVIGRQLGLAGYASEAVDDGVQGLQAWRSGRFALILSDVHMPVMDGYQMTQTLRQEEAGSGKQRTPVVALTAAALRGEAERCLAAGMDDYLAKPVSIPALAACLRKWLPHTALHATASTDNVDAATLPQAHSDPAPLDVGTLDELTGGNRHEIRELLDDFMAATDTDVHEMQLALKAGDVVGIGRQAHKIKGASRLVGASQLAEAASDLEMAAKASDWPQLLPLSADVQTVVERLRLHIREMFPT